MFKAEIMINGYRGNRCLDCRFKIDSLCLLYGILFEENSDNGSEVFHLRHKDCMVAHWHYLNNNGEDNV